MSARGNGMIAHAKPMSLDSALDKIMLDNDPSSLISESRPPVAEVSASEPVTTPEKVSVPVRKKPEKGSALVGGILGELTAQKKRPRNKVTLNTRIDDFVEEAINKCIRDLEEQGQEVTKEAIVILSLIRGLNITPPEGWELL